MLARNRRRVAGLNEEEEEEEGEEKEKESGACIIDAGPTRRPRISSSV